MKRVNGRLIYRGEDITDLNLPRYSLFEVELFETVEMYCDSEDHEDKMKEAFRSGKEMWVFQTPSRCDGDGVLVGSKEEAVDALCNRFGVGEDAVEIEMLKGYRMTRAEAIAEMDFQDRAEARTADQSYKQMLESSLKFAKARFREYGDERGLFEGDPEWTWEDEIAETEALLFDLSRPKKTKKQRRAERAEREKASKTAKERKKSARIRASKWVVKTRNLAQQNGFELKIDDIRLLLKKKFKTVSEGGEIKFIRTFKYCETDGYRYEIMFDKVRDLWVAVFVILGLNEGDDVRFESKTLSQIISDLNRERNKLNKRRKQARERANEIKKMTENWHRGFV